MEVKLVLASGRKAGLEVPVRRKKFFIGRAKDCQLRLQSDSIGRHHCVILIDGELAAVRDFGIESGTHVNGERVKGERELNHGDRLKVGHFEFEVQLVDVADERTTPVAEPPVEAEPQAVLPSGDDELDLDSWLAVPETANDGHPQTNGTEIPETVASELAAKEPKKRDKVDVVGVWQKGRWNPTTVDPRTAAADALKGFFRRPG